MIAAPRLDASRWLLAACLGGWTACAPAMTLTEALMAADGHDPTRAVFEAQFAADREAGIIERAAIRPQVNLKGAANYAHTESKSTAFSALGSGEGETGGGSEEEQQAFTGVFKDSYPAWSATASLRQPLFRLDWFDIGDRARALESQADLTRRSAQLDLQLRVAQRYFNVLIAQDQLAQAEAEARAVGQSLDSTRQRYEVELAPGTDLKEAQARHDLAQAALVSARRNLENARDELDETTGAGDASLPALPPEVSFPPLLPANVDEWVGAARGNSPRIALAEQSAIVARTRYQSARASAYPTLDLVGSVGRDDTSDFAFGQRTDDARVGVELNIPLYAGGATLAGLRQASAQRDVAEAELTRIQRETERATRQQYRTVETAYIEVNAYQRSLASAETAEIATRNGYDAGTRTITDVLDAQSRVVQSRRDLNTARYNLLLGLLQLKQTVGRLTVADFSEIDRLLAQPATP